MNSGGYKLLHYYTMQLGRYHQCSLTRNMARVVVGAASSAALGCKSCHIFTPTGFTILAFKTLKKLPLHGTMALYSSSPEPWTLLWWVAIRRRSVSLCSPTAAALMLFKNSRWRRMCPFLIGHASADRSLRNHFVQNINRSSAMSTFGFDATGAFYNGGEVITRRPLLAYPVLLIA